MERRIREDRKAWGGLGNARGQLRQAFRTQIPPIRHLWGNIHCSMSPNEPVQFLRKDIAVFTSALYQTNTTFFETPNAVFLVDPCWLPFEIFRIREYVESVRKKRRLFLIFTHSDYDHIIGYRAFPGAKVIASRQFVRNAYKERDTEQCLEFDRKHYIERDYPIEYPEVDIEIDKDGKSLHFSGTVLTFYLSPGHTPSGMMILFEPAGLWVAGDYLSDIEPPLIEDSITAYRRTMAKTERILRTHDVRFMVPGHGTVATTTEEIRQRRSESDEYLADLEAAISGAPFPEGKYRDRYRFQEGFREFHQANMTHCSM